MAVRVLVVVVALVTLPFALGYRPKVDFFPPPKDFEARLDYVGRALLDGRTRELEKVASTGTGEFGAELAQDARPTVQVQGRPENEQVGHLQGREGQGEPLREGRIELVLRMLGPDYPERPEVAQRQQSGAAKEPMEAGYNADGTLDIPTVWVIDGPDLWALDVGRSLEIASGMK